MFRVVFFAILFILSINVSGAEEAQKNEDSQKATLIVHRERFSPPLSFKPLMKINGVKAFYLPRGYHAKLSLEPGDYHIQADWKALHGVPDRSLDVSLRAGETSYLTVHTSQPLSFLGAYEGANSDLSTSEVDLSGSRELTRFHAQWMLGLVGGFVPEETLNERYDITIDNEKLLADFKAGDEQEKMELAKYLIRREIYDEALLMVFEEEALNQYQNDFLSKVDTLPLAFIFKYIASSRMLEFKDSIVEISLNAKHKNIRKYAEKYLSTYYGED